MTLCTASATAAILSTDFPGPQITIWWLAHMVVVALMMARRFFIGPERDAAGNPRRRGERGIDMVTAGLSGLLWGSGALFLDRLGLAYQVLLITATGGMIAGAAATMAVVPRAAALYMLTAAVPYITGLFLRGDGDGIGLALMASAFTVAMLFTNRLIFGVIRRNRLLHEENTALYERVRAAQEELLNVAESSEAFALVDAAGRLQLWNHRFPALLGIDEQTLQRNADLAAVLETAGLSDLLQEKLSGGATRALPNGRFVRARIRETPQGDRALIVIDNTEQQELLRKASAARDAALAASQAKTIFLANMSHELRTPLNAIIGFSDLVQQRMFGPESPKYDEYLRDINASARHLLDVINDILDLARIEANQIVLNETDVFLDEEIATCARLAASQFGRTQQAVTIEVDPDLPPLIADGRLVRQVLLNLMANGFKFSPGATPIEAGARLNAQGEIEVWVRDYGIGIAKEDQARIFEPFEQADTQLSRKYGGVGLGLSLVRAFAAAHQGRLEIDSAPGEGTRVTVVFPAVRTGRA
ncbi:MAG TPA: ATP-binding protein [Ferrovibrio sp.]|uniref:sensor histidine kinase n=1 Tax=Ferrovibrio sp. TaxID=1917215 RepID=UPI002B4B8588|nr:ATP-binding protein [Ferrovibrio sp.]HLT77952.1 ATP-binding protein [Ferrovibrio sp.]